MDATVGTPAATDEDPLVGRLLDGRYRLDAAIARGGMATVYRATDLRLDRTVAVKVMRPALAEDPDFVDRFAREARAAARLSSPEVVAVHDQGTDAATGTAYLVMEHVAGITLRDVVRDAAPLTPARALDLLEPVLRALAAAHGAGLVHRDVKPENVLLGDDGQVKVADFGLARAIESSNLTATTGLLIGTVAYLAPEQVEHGRADTRTDVYAAGILLFELLTGVPPYFSDSPLSVAYRHVNEDVPPPSPLVEGIPVVLDDLVLAATRRDPAARPVDAGAFLAELRAVRSGLGPATGPVVRRVDHPTLVVSREELAAHTASTPASTPADAPAAAKPKRAGRVSPLVLWSLVAALLMTVGVAGGWYLTSGRFTTAPTATGLAEAAAVEQLLAAGFEVTVDPDPQFSETVAAGLVLSQDPGPGERVRRGGEITLVLSQGPDRRAVPEVAGQQQQEAVDALEGVGLEAGEITQAFSDQPVGTVLSSDPAAGEQLREGTPVALVVSKGVELLDVPDVVGAPQADAEAALDAAGFTAEVTEVFSESVARGTVVAQDPADGQAPRGSAVALQVSKGPELITVPDVTGQRRAQAEAALTALGLKTRVFAIPGPGTVRSTDPGAGATVRKGATITVYVF
ncbi:MAG: Stk1 family PASTA domain-containing Ser/Thr kinase [Frankiaceae bacterium]|nr:Stk1 family PASTA domain-containing Ser/Thr kinase [Frankiaceae bacterium]